jgi:CHASE2 domain-containing sensor protein
VARLKNKGHDRNKRQGVNGQGNGVRTKQPFNVIASMLKWRGLRKLIIEPLHTQHGKVIIVSLFTSLLLFLALHTNLFSLFKFDDLLNRQFVAYTEAYVDKVVSRDIVILIIEGDSKNNGELGAFGSGWRKYHSHLIDALSNAGAKVIAFDMYFEDVSSENDENLGRAIQQASKKGTKVILGVRDYKATDGSLAPQTSPKLASYLNSGNWGQLEIGGTHRDSPLIRKLRLAEDRSNDLPSWIEAEKYPVVPSFPLQVAMQFWAGTESVTAIYDKDKNQIDVQASGGSTLRSVPVQRDMSFIFDIADKNVLDKMSFSYGEIFRNIQDTQYLTTLFKGKVVLIGVRATDDLRPVSNNYKRYGIEILASVTSNLLQSFYIRPLSDLYQYLLILMMCFAGALLQTRLKNWMQYTFSLKIFGFTDTKLELPIALGLVGALYLLAAFLVYVQTRYILNIPYQLAGLVITFYLLKVILPTRSI